ncbi:MAG: hypothetical protein KGJ03_01965 [Betaproteobacteria bacterium]|uniref:hypothetical protein n=1 Tax=Thiomonas sp. FB-6 TaxID=1158291 RepID=UPI0012DFC7B9|nr:hypothetical protein [Thiomonas sp. FB-6]MBU6440659.1 hypothetical protein [Betaproteobacteria bacterium]MBU6512343.1 hypothetical protein [Betaproteobacteria bacterium]MDE1954463.1 hypothetical protein [Betaproteobacteria bacterium]MDE2152582.1 hypothetical protein [Betaproteobacteria bacterium]MDE2479259.1 hypothetical protein [Betaproteobacteria bacterium]
MKTRSAVSMFSLPAQACATPASVMLRRGAWIPEAPRSVGQPALRPAVVTGQPVREALRGLLAMLQRARALNSRTL